MQRFLSVCVITGAIALGTLAGSAQAAPVAGLSRSCQFGPLADHCRPGGLAPLAVASPLVLALAALLIEMKRGGGASLRSAHLRPRALSN